MHHEVEHPVRDRPYPPNEWEEPPPPREWRGRGMWDRENLPRPEPHEEEWPARYENPIVEWKVGEPRKWDNQPPVHLRGGYRNDRLKELELGDPAHM